ncbi:uncharacterized protein LOC141908700 [Tubulanus polymorphus]|uniref:uncharacterized protein LOC141908700 n=1 Tax=Tubulanus polymorphus TaxID=672921 RepID=UPI003DA46514
MPYYNWDNVEDASERWTTEDRLVADGVACGRHWMTYGILMHIFAFSTSIIPPIFHFYIDQSSFRLNLQGALYVVAVFVYFAAGAVAGYNYKRPSGTCLKGNLYVSTLTALFSIALIGVTADAISLYLAHSSRCLGYIAIEFRLNKRDQRICTNYLRMNQAGISALVAAILGLVAAFPMIFCAKMGLRIKRDYILNRIEQHQSSFGRNEPTSDRQEVSGEMRGRELRSDGRISNLHSYRQQLQAMTREQIEQYCLQAYGPEVANSANSEHPASPRYSMDHEPELDDNTQPGNADIAAPPPSYNDVIQNAPPTYDAAVTALNNTQTTAV